MPKACFVSAILLFVFVNKTSAQIDSAMNRYAEKFAPEKLHIQMDRSIYRKGETIFFKVYALSSTEVAPISKTVYIDWYDDDGKLLLQTQAPLFIAGAKGSFTIPPDYKKATVNLKAYTKWMLNFDTAFIYRRSINLDQSKSAAINKTTGVAPITQVQLYPEGGFSVAGVNNRLAFKATDQLGKPMSIKAVIKTGNRVLIDSIETVHDGMGMFTLNMQDDEAYSFNWRDENGNTGELPFKAQKQSAVVLKVSASNKKAVFTIERAADAGNNFKTLHLLVHRGYMLRYKLDINMASKSVLSSEVLLNDLQDGLLQFTLFDADWLPVAERLIFLKSRSPRFFPTVSILKKDLSKKGLNEIEINVPDTLLSNMSVSVTEATFADLKSPTIFTDFLLSSEMKGKINNPGYYFTDAGDSSLFNDKDSMLAEQLDLVMLTNGHRRYDWEQIASGKARPVEFPADNEYLEIKGKIASKKLLKQQDSLSLNVIVQGKDSSRNMLVLPVDKDGRFVRKDFIYYDTAKLYYSLNNTKKINNEVAFETSLMTGEERKKYFKNVTFELTGLPMDATKKATPITITDSFTNAYEKKLEKQKATLLKEVTVKSRVKTSKEILDNFYTSGMYSGEINSYSFDIEGDIRAPQYQDIFVYLETKIPGFRVEGTGTDLVTPFWGLGVPAFLLDEVPISIEGVRTISVSNIAYVKAFRPPFLGTRYSEYGAIAIYMKKGYSPLYTKDETPGLNTFLLNGYSRFKEFIQPDYEDDFSKNEQDYRPTVYWNPFILTDRSNPKFTFEFYNNDISKKLCLVLEGINATGQITRVVKVIE